MLGTCVVSESGTESLPIEDDCTLYIVPNDVFHISRRSNFITPDYSTAVYGNDGRIIIRRFLVRPGGA